MSVDKSVKQQTLPFLPHSLSSVILKIPLPWFGQQDHFGRNTIFRIQSKFITCHNRSHLFSSGDPAFSVRDVPAERGDFKVVLDDPSEDSWQHKEYVALDAFEVCVKL